MKASLFKEEIIDRPATDNGVDFNPDENNLSKQKSERYSEDTQHRSRLINWVMWIIPSWLGFVLAIIAFIDISDVVKTTLLVTTTANVIGLALVVLRGMFGEDKT